MPKPDREPSEPSPADAELSDAWFQSTQLSPAGAELLDAWMQSRQVAPEQLRIDMPTLVRYLSGALAAADARSVESALVRDPAARALLKTTRDELKRMRALTWSEVAKLASEDSAVGEIARAWIALASLSVELSGPARTSWSGWQTIRDGITAGVAAAAAAWANLSAVGEQLRYAAQAAPPAVARGGDDEAVVIEGDVPDGVFGFIYAELDRAGLLSVTLSLKYEDGNESTSIDGASVYLSLSVNGMSWPLGASTIEADAAAWRLPDAGRALGLPAGQIPGDFFRTELGDERRAAEGDRIHLLSEVLPTGAVASPIPVPVIIHGRPTWDAGLFTTHISVDAAVRLAYAERRLRLDLNVAGGQRQCLGYWPLSEWGDDPRVITAECPGSPPSAAAYPTILHAAIV